MQQERIIETKTASDQMDFSGWNSDMESSLLDRAGNDNNWDETMNEWTELTTFPTGSYETEAKAIAGVAKDNAGGSGISENESLSLPSSTTTRDGVASVSESSDRSSLGPKHTGVTARSIASGLHPQAIQSSAMCPPHSKILPPSYEHIYPAPMQQQNQAASNIYELNLRRVAAAASAGPPPPPAPMMQMQQQQQSGDVSSSIASSAQQQYQNQALLSSLATNFRLAQQTTTTGAAASNSNGPPAPAPRAAASNKRKSRARQGSTQKNSRSGSSQKNKKQQKAQAPPFLLFDAPLELRTSFNQNQRRLGMPVKNDCNSYHYGESVKGFHPQHLGSTDGGAFPHRNKELEKTMVQLIDGRHAPQATTGRIKNEREQKRAQKITVLIDQLGDIMKEGGWNVETKSKYQTLSSCTEYMRHLIKTKGDKEEAVKKLKKDLEIKKQRMEEDKTAQEGKSDLESVTSSLTSSTTWSSRVNSKTSQGGALAAHKKEQISRNDANLSISEDSSGFSRTNGGPNQAFCIDKAVSSVSDLTDSNRGSSSNNSGSGGSGTRTGSGASGTGSGSGGSGSRGSGSTEREPALGGPPKEAAVREEDERTTSSISSDAAVASEKSSRDRHSESQQHTHMDVVFNNSKKRKEMKPPESGTSTERSFELDYEEVFDQSNIPQLIAGTSGKIVSWNQSFVNATGLEESDLERMTIFSLVQPDNLSSFFEIAATALRSNDEDDGEPSSEEVGNKQGSQSSQSQQQETSQDESQTSQASSSSKEQETQRKWNYDALTLPCIEFPAMKERRESSSKWENVEKLNMTMILITDPDPRKRCFHCTFTDCPGTDGTLGIVTPDLLAALYSNPEKLNLEQHPHYRRKHKRAKIQAKAATKQKLSKNT